MHDKKLKQESDEVEPLKERQEALPLPNKPTTKPLTEAQKHCYTSTILAAMEQMQDD